MKELIFLAAFCITALIFRAFEEAIFALPITIYLSNIHSFTPLFSDGMPYADRVRNSEWINLLMILGCLIHFLKHLYFHVIYKVEFIETSYEIADSWELFKKDFAWIALQAFLSLLFISLFLSRKILKLTFPISGSIFDFGFWLIILYIVTDVITLSIKYIPTLMYVLKLKVMYGRH